MSNEISSHKAVWEAPSGALNKAIAKLAASLGTYGSSVIYALCDNEMYLKRVSQYMIWYLNAPEIAARMTLVEHFGLTPREIDQVWASCSGFQKRHMITRALKRVRTESAGSIYRGDADSWVPMSFYAVVHEVSKNGHEGLREIEELLFETRLTFQARSFLAAVKKHPRGKGFLEIDLKEKDFRTGFSSLQAHYPDLWPLLSEFTCPRSYNEAMMALWETLTYEGRR